MGLASESGLYALGVIASGCLEEAWLDGTKATVQKKSDGKESDGGVSDDDQMIPRGNGTQGALKRDGGTHVISTPL